MTCAAHVQAVGQGFPGQLGIFGDQHLEGLTRLAGAIRAAGSLASAQLHHAGHRSPKDLVGTPVCPSDHPETGARSLTPAEVERLRDDFIQDSVSGVEGWNVALQKHGIDFKFAVPHKAFNRQIGQLAGVRVSPQGRVVSEAVWQNNVRDWLPTAADREYVQSLMGRVVEPGKFANWIAPPSAGINGQPVECEYVRFS